MPNNQIFLPVGTQVVIRKRVPELAILGTAKKLERPMLAEGFDILRYVVNPENT